MVSNFSFLQSEWLSLYKKMKKAEERVYAEPISAASYCRLTLEETIYNLFDFEYLELPYNTDLLSLMNHEDVKNIIPLPHKNGLHIVRKIGNNAAHFGKKVSKEDALISVKYLYSYLKWFSQNYSKEIPELPGAFNQEFVPKVGADQRKIQTLKQEQVHQQAILEAQIQKLLNEKAAILAKAEASEASLLLFKEKEATAKLLLQQQKQERLIPLSTEFTEAETRKHLIDVNLKEVGWDRLTEGREIEFAVSGMPITVNNPKGNGFVDYVLWNDNGLPLALIEAKRTTKDVEVGKHQAYLYANCLEQMFGVRPVIFYTNGYETKIWDDTFYNGPRRVYGFYTKEELQWLIQQRSTRQDIRNASINPEIAGRPYQMEAIQRIAEDFIAKKSDQLRGSKRNALLVMATGSGKTRTAAALVDILFKNNWVKRVLFLADRNALVRQAKRNFGDLLPHLSSIDLTEEKENNNTRLVFSTYPSMINKIDNVKAQDGRFYGVGHFDLIIVDEAHRSIYNKYKSIFDYFDAMVVGLTATPKESIDHNTFELFDCGNGDPTFNYDLDQAVPTYLKTYKNIDVSTKFIREGIKYSELSDKDKSKYEDTFEDKDSGWLPENISAAALNKWLFNEDTVNKVLDALMQKGLKIEGGDKLGRTIIFAANQRHAQFIIDCFNKRYPEQPSNFIAAIHNKVSHAQSLIDAFCDMHHEKLPQIAVSVDMMDTGIDAPRVLNLVFFKAVRSYAKFWQMIGRGTRLCPDVFGPNNPKEYFLIFDVCQNFDFFEINPNGTDGAFTKPITRQIFESRLQLSRLLAETGEQENIDLANTLLDNLHSLIKNLDPDRFQVNMSKRYVDQFKERSQWNNLSTDDVHLIETHLSSLPAPETINETARRFDLMMLKMQIANLLMLHSENGYREHLITIAEQLAKKYTIPQVSRYKPLIETMKSPDFYKGISQKKLDQIRQDIRELVQYLDQVGKNPIYTNIQDSDISIIAREPLPTYSTGKIYKQRVEAFIRDHKNQLTIAKLASNQAITAAELEVLENILFDGEERGSREDFVKEYGEQPLGKFIRSILGLEMTAAQQAFADFLQSGNLRADQMTFINNIIKYLTKNGSIDKGLLFEPPFTDVNDQGLVGVFEDADAYKIISIIDTINENATKVS